MTRVKALLRRSAMDTEQEKVMELGNIVLNDKRHFVSVDGEQIELTYKEFELLKFLMINTGIVMTRESIMHSVWGVDFELESRTVDMHIKTLRQKLKTGAERIKTIRNVGYVME
jgi:two-component system alkaline phosphatase synthesis response regulator PhoP